MEGKMGLEQRKIALFGEAEKGELRTAYLCQSLEELSNFLGNPPRESHGLYMAVQLLLHNYHIIYFRVREEGYSLADYKDGLRLLQDKPRNLGVSALCLPGVGQSEIIEESARICLALHSLLIMSEKDLYDYLTDSKS